MRSKKYKIGDLVYWRRNAVQSVLLDPGIVTQIKSDTQEAIQTWLDANDNSLYLGRQSHTGSLKSKSNDDHNATVTRGQSDRPKVL